MRLIVPLVITIVGVLIAVSASLFIANATACRVASETVTDISVYAPVGTVVGSMLSPEQFADLMDEDINGELSERKWILADGRDAAGTDYAEAAGKPVPDLRGMFLRGLNAGRDDGKEDPGNVLADPAYDRFPGHYQEGLVGSHGHDYEWYPEERGAARLPATWYGKATEARTDIFNPIRESHGVETRPANIAVYWYIRVNN